MSNGARSGLLAMAMTLLVLSCATHDPAFEVEAGLIGFSDVEGQPRVRLLEKTHRIHRAVGPLTGLGFRISSSSDQPFLVQTEHFLPGTPDTIGKITFEGYTQKDAATGMKTKPVEVTGQRYFFWGFDEADPLGEYRIDIYVDGKFLQTLRFTVVE